MAELEGRVALVTGAARGIGAAIARELAAAGARVACADMDTDGARAVAEALSKEGTDTVTIGGDVSLEADAAGMVEGTVAALGGLDVLVHNAGVWIIKTLEETTPEEWDRQVGTNLRGLYLLARAAIPALRRSEEGCIVHLASMAASRYTVPHIAYAASKAGVVAATRDLAVELAADRIRVNAVAPGPIDTRGLTDGMNALQKEEFESKYLLGRMGRPEDIAHAVAFLVSRRASYITGATLPVTGGAELAIRPVM